MEPQRFGDYVLLERVAVGGMAEVYRARLAREGGVQRQVCIKRVHPKHSADPSFSAMFIDEARIGVTLSHGNIVPVFDFGCVDGLYYIAMEYVEGRDLAQIAARVRIAKKCWPLPVAVFVTMEILEGLDYAHERCDELCRPLRIVHRDVSPSNVLVSSRGEVKILDFGIARADSREVETRTGVIKGTPGYMAPEQAAGQHPDRRADIYSVGVVLWELLRSERAPRGSEPFAAAPDPEIDAVLRQALEPDPSRRLATARGFHDRLGQLLAARGLLPSSHDLRAFTEDVFATQAPQDDWRYRDSTDSASLRSLEVLPPIADELTPQNAAQQTENLGPDAPSPSRFVQSVRTGRRRSSIVGMLVVALAITAGAFAVVPEKSRDPVRRAAVPAPRPPANRRLGSVHLVTIPRGAKASLDDGWPEPTPARFDDVAPGTHQVRIELEGYEPLVRGLAVLPGETATIELPLNPRRARVRVSSVPKGARILVDDVVRGQAPVEVAGLDPSLPHRVDAALDGHEPSRSELRLQPGEQRELELRLRPLERGRLFVNVSDWAEVVLDGTPIGNTPIVGFPVSAGRHRLECKNPQRNVSAGQTIWVRPGQDLRVSPF